TMTSQQNRAGTWRNGYESVWHLTGDPNNGAPQFFDSAGNNHGTADSGMTSVDEVSAKIQEGTDFDGTSDDINVGLIDSNLWTAVTMSAWVYKRDNGDDRVFSVAPTTNTADSRFALLMNSNNFAARIGTDGTGGTVSSTITGSAYTTNTWYHFAVTWDSVTEMIYIYVDGIQVGFAAKDGDTIRDAVSDGLIANAAVGYDRYFNGTIDEVRVGYTARSVAWIETEFNNQDDPGAFVSVGSQQYNLQFEDAVDHENSNVDGVADLGVHSNFYDERSKDGIYDTLTETYGVNTHSINSATSSSHVRIGDGSADWRSPIGTISFWVYFSSTASDRPWGLSSDMEWDNVGNNRYTFDWGTNDIVPASSILNNFTWYYFAVTWNEYTNSFKFYIGDESTTPTVDVSTSTWTGSLSSAAMGTNTFLASNGGSEIIGNGDELRYYDIERSLTDIQSDYKTTLTGNEYGLRSYFKFDNDLIDYGPDGHDATIVSTVPFQTSPLPSWDDADSRLDLEVQFQNIPYQVAAAELAIYTGSTDAENILVDYWNGSDWINIHTDLAPNSWNNISVANYVKYEEFTIRFRDGTTISDLNQDTWQIDAVLLKLNNYQLDWEHQSQSVDTGRENYYLSIYGSTTDPYETFEIQLWNQATLNWITLATAITNTKQWHNISITDPEFLGTTVTWRYKGDNETRDGYQGTLNIDYAAIVSYDEAPVFVSTPIDITGYIEGDTGYSLTWNSTDDNPNTYTIYREDVPIDSGSWTNAADITINIDGLLKGLYNFTIEVIDDNGNPSVDQVDVTVIDATLPVFVSIPNDLQYNETYTGNSLIWNSTDSYPDTYTLYRNGTEVATLVSWDSSSSINYNVDGLSKGVYNFTIVIFDQSSNSVLDEVWVTVVDSTPPSFDTVPSDYQYDEGTTGHTLTWNFTDLYEATYTIYRNGTQIDSNTWTNASDVTINIDGLTTAFYNFTIIVFDDTGNYNIDIVWVEVIDSGPPTFNSSPPNIQYEEEATGNTLTWNVNDQTPNNYTIYQWDGTTNTTVESGSWLSDVDIAINVDGLSKGVYNYSIWLYDLSGNSVYHSVLVTVVDTTPPVVDNPANMQYFEGNSGNTITWVASDNHPDKLTIYRNGSFIFSTGWTTGNIIWNIDGLEYGVYNYTILLTDKSNNQITSAVWVTVIDNTPPIIDTPDDIIYPTGSSGNEIEWIGEDFHPSYYELRRNGTVIDGSGVWVSQGTIRIDIDGLEIKIYIYNITLFDESGNTISDEVIVEVTEESVFKSVPEDYFYLIGETGNFLNWTVSDANPDKYIIYREE
ncbi:MAG: LamG-like jellyroll fold domain-containing protein, partial [Candidatus Kariarchaeaceae archaeon]